VIRKRASELFHQIDPSLKVIDGGTHHHRHRRRRVTREDWDETAGVICPDCKQETLRLIEGICPRCYNAKIAEKEERLGRKREKRYLVSLFNRGKISLRQMRDGRLS